jgi:hypothetical protein
MSVAEAPSAADLRGLYGRYKALALATGAALVLGEPAEALGEDAAALEADCREAAASARGELVSPLDACVSAAAELRALVGDGTADPDAVERVRASHRRLRSEVWKVVPCEYVPCAPGHVHAEERQEGSDG